MDEQSNIITTDIMDDFDYSESTQLKIVAELFRNKQFSSEALPRLKRSYFTKDIFGDIVHVLQDFVATYKSLPESSDIYLDHFRDMAATNKTLDITEAHKEISHSFLSKNSDGTWVFSYEPAVIHNKVNGFIKEASMKDALWACVNLLSRNKADKYDKIKEIISDAAAVDVANNRIPLAQFLTAKKDLDMNRTTPLIGYELTKFRTLAKHIDGIQPGVYHIAAETNAGKTALATNLAMDILLSNEQVCVIYFSFDDNKNTIVNRFLGLLSRLHLNQLQKKQANTVSETILTDAYQLLMGLAREKRLDILELSEVMSIINVESAIRKRAKDSVVVFIDGLYNMEVGEKSKGGIREDNIERANKIKALADTYRIPIICTGEIRKKQKNNSDAPTVDDMMETGKFAYNANLVLLLYPESRLDYKTADSPIIRVEFAKNKLSHYRGEVRLCFHKAQNRMEEVEDVYQTAMDNFKKKRGNHVEGN